jgi:glucose-1-phosphate thymidylyltransferase
MKGLILAGGYGTRLRPITYSQQKQLIPVGNKPILFYGIEDLIEAGVTTIGIVVGPNKERVIETVKNKRWDAEFVFIEQSAPKGLAHAIKVASEFLADDSFIMYLGDNILKGGVETYVKRFIGTNADATILLTEVPNPHEFGVAELDVRGKVIKLIEKPKTPPTNLVMIGVYFFKPIILEAVNHIKPSWRNQLEITDAVQWLIDHGYKVTSARVMSWWKDTGKPDDILDANRLVLEDIEYVNLGRVDASAEIKGRVAIGKNTIIKDSAVVRGPTIIGEDCTITNAYIGPYTSIGNNCEIHHAEIESSVIMEGTKINCKRRIVDSLIGAGAKVLESTAKPDGYRLVIGDSSEVKL